MVALRRSVLLLLAMAFASFLNTIDAACVEREPVEGNVTESTMDKIAYYFSEASCQLRPVVAKVKESVKEGYDYLKFKIDEYNNRNKTEVKHIKTDNITIVIINQNCNNGEDQIIFRDDKNKKINTNKSPGTIHSDEETESDELVFRDSDEETFDVPARLPITTEQSVKGKPEVTTESRVAIESNEPIYVPTTVRSIETTVKAKPEFTIESKVTTEPNESVYVPNRLPIETTVKVEPEITTESKVTKRKVMTESAATIVFRDDDDGPINFSTGLPLKTEPTTTIKTTVTSEFLTSTPAVLLDDRIALTVPEMCPKGEVKINGKCELEIDL